MDAQVAWGEEKHRTLAMKTLRARFKKTEGLPIQKTQGNQGGYLEEVVLEQSMEGRGRFRQVKAHREGDGDQSLNSDVISSHSLQPGWTLRTRRSVRGARHRRTHVKPDPPEGVRLSPLPGQRLWVQWEPPRSWPFPEIFSLKYRIRYKRHGAARFRQVGPIEGTSFTLKAVRPQAKYCIQVAALDLTDYGESSAWSLPAVASVTLGK
ncbi:interleukin-27 subunit beta [Physeter macrocephalus]|uniref:Interleukin-27 subunit beta n=1 Tax=Physeter macrocephalus TaxID=9755 RepID=A0A455BQZ7_PHYMC|nr:interleukin-27 subunit beta [Physeter catodon]